jgi:hypothetical protein
MTKNPSFLCFSFVFNDLIANENARISIYGGPASRPAAGFTTLFSNKRPDTGIPYRAARARTIPDKVLEVKLFTAKNGPIPARFPDLPKNGDRPRFSVKTGSVPRLFAS